MSLLELGSTNRVYNCPACSETMNTSLSACPACGTGIDPVAAGKAADAQQTASEAWSSANATKITAEALGAGFIVLTGAMIRAGATTGGGDPHSSTHLPVVLWWLFAVGSAVIMIQVLSWFIRFKAIDH